MERNSLYPLYVVVLYGPHISTFNNSKDLVALELLTGKESLCCFARGQMLQMVVGGLQGKAVI